MDRPCPSEGQEVEDSNGFFLQRLCLRNMERAELKTVQEAQKADLVLTKYLKSSKI